MKEIYYETSGALKASNTIAKNINNISQYMLSILTFYFYNIRTGKNRKIYENWNEMHDYVYSKTQSCTENNF